MSPPSVPDAVETIRMALTADPPLPAALLAATAWAAGQAGRLLVDAGRGPAGERILALGAPTIEDTQMRSDWIKRVKVERRDALRRVQRNANDHNRTLLSALTAPIQLAAAARDGEPASTGCETLLAATRGACRHRVLWLLDDHEHDGMTRHDVDAAVADVIAAGDDDLAQHLRSRAVLKHSRWERATVMSTPLVATGLGGLASMLRQALSVDAIAVLEASAPHVAPGFILRLPVDVLSRLDEYAEAEGLSREGLIRRLIKEALGG